MGWLHPCSVCELLYLPSFQLPWTRPHILESFDVFWESCQITPCGFDSSTSGSCCGPQVDDGQAVRPTTTCRKQPGTNCKNMGRVLFTGVTFLSSLKQKCLLYFPPALVWSAGCLDTIYLWKATVSTRPRFTPGALIICQCSFSIWDETQLSNNTMWQFFPNYFTVSPLFWNHKSWQPNPKYDKSINAHVFKIQAQVQWGWDVV